MAFAGIFQPFARLRWILFGLFIQARNSAAGLLLPNFYFRLLTFYLAILEIKEAGA
jgi:hypothetical protein